MVTLLYLFAFVKMNINMLVILWY